MCGNAIGCSRREMCYRFTAKPCGDWQCYADFYDKDDVECKYFWQDAKKQSTVPLGTDPAIPSSGS